MSTRRPRIKASANLSLASKRKPKSLADSCEKVKNVEKPEDINTSESVQNVETDSVAKKEETNLDSPTPDDGTKCVSHPLSPQFLDTPWNANELSQNRLKPFEDAFKYPQNPEYKRPLTANTVEDNLVSDFEDNILHMDLQKSPGFPMSPTKSRQRIRPTPIFGQRRNSFVGSSPSPHTEDEPTLGTRQRSSNSTSSDISSNFFVRRLAAGNIGRIRTESGCSTISDSRASTRKNHSEEYRNVTKREYQARFNGKVPDKSTLKMFDLIYYNPSTNPMEQKTSGVVQNSTESESMSSYNTSKELETTPESTHSAIPVPQLKLGSNGEMMIDEKSLEIETTAEVEARKLLANTSLIYHDENTGSEGFYRKHKRTKDWLPEETIKFYRCLQTVGTDFSLMLTLFPNRTRRDLKLKFKKEERCNLNLINKALLYPGTFNIEDLKEQLDAEEEERREQERIWKEIKAKEPKKIKKVSNASSSSSRVLVTGDDIYQNENITKGKLSKRLVTSSSVQSKHKRKKRTSELVPDHSLNSIDENILENEINDILDPRGVPDDTNIMDSMSGGSSLNEASISIILNELANGTLAYVSSVDPKSPDKIINEIYVLDTESGQLSDKPLDLPEEIIDAIRSVMIS